MPLTIKPSSGSGSITLQATTGTTTNDTLTLPASTGTVALTASPTFTGTTTTGAQSVGGNITFSAADAGIIFNKTGALTNSTLNDYEEGSWTPNDQSGASLTFTSITARYTKIGRLVNLNFQFTFPSTANASNIQIGGLPFVPGSGNATGALGTDQTGAFNIVTIASAVNYIYIRNTSNQNPTNANFSGKFVSAAITYIA